MKKFSGFTLIELLIVVAILGVMAIAGLASYTGSITRGRDSQRKSDLAQVSRALELYYNDHGKYPVDNGAGVLKGCGEAGTEECAWGTAFAIEGGSVYMNKFPKDPQGSQSYYYVSQNGLNYKLYAHLETKDDKDTKDYSGTQGWCVIGGASDTEFCNYAVTSGNVTP